MLLVLFEGFETSKLQEKPNYFEIFEVMFLCLSFLFL